MGSGKHISTGIDKLVEIIKDKKRISINEASKSLGVSSALIQEWANFLEDEGVISQDYKLTGTFLNEKDITKEDVTKKEKELTSKKENFVKTTKARVKHIENHRKNIKSIKKNSITSQIKLKLIFTTLKRILIL